MRKTQKKHLKTDILKEMFNDLDPDPFSPGRIPTPDPDQNEMDP